MVDSKAFSEQIITIVMNIAKALKPYEKVKIEKLIEIFDFNLSMAKRLLSAIIKDNSIDKSGFSGESGSLNLYHKLVELMIYSG